MPRSTFGNPYSAIAHVPAPEVQKSMVDFVRTFAMPDLPDKGEKSIVRGQQNRVSMPNNREYVLFNIINIKRRGTNIKIYENSDDTPEVGTLTELTLRECRMQVDFYSKETTSHQRAESFVTAFRGSMGAAFLQERGISPAYCKDIQILEDVSGLKQFDNRAMVDCTLLYYSGLKATLPFIVDVKALAKDINTLHKED